MLGVLVRQEHMSITITYHATLDTCKGEGVRSYIPKKLKLWLWAKVWQTSPALMVASAAVTAAVDGKPLNMACRSSRGVSLLVFGTWWHCTIKSMQALRQ